MHGVVMIPTVKHQPAIHIVQFVGNDGALATLPGTGVGQNLVSLAPCAVNQPHVHPRGTEISHITKGTGMDLHTVVVSICIQLQAVNLQCIKSHHAGTSADGLHHLLCHMLVQIECKATGHC